MEESIQNTSKAKYMALKEIRQLGLGEDVEFLVSEDIDYGIGVADALKYAKSGMTIKEMEVYSKCLRDKLSEEAISLITSRQLNYAQMNVAYEFYEKGIPLDTIKEVISNKNNAFRMKLIFKDILLKMNEAEKEVQKAPDYIKVLFDDIKNVVSNIKFDEDKLEEINKKLNDKLSLLETFKEDIYEKESYEKDLKEKDKIILDQQDKLNQANQAIARLRQERELARTEIKNMKEEINILKSSGSSQEEIILDRSMNEQVARTSEYEFNPYEIDRDYKKSRKGLIELISKLLLRKRGSFNIMKKVIEKELTPGQISLIKMAMEKGLKERQVEELINNKITQEQMQEIIEIAVLENALEEAN